MKHSAKKRKREGTRNAQTRTCLAKQLERDALIQKRRRMRIERQRRLNRK